MVVVGGGGGNLCLSDWFLTMLSLSFCLFTTANQMTGLVNLTMRTIYMDTLPSFAIIVGYMLLVCGVAWVLKDKRIKL